MYFLTPISISQKFGDGHLVARGLIWGSCQDVSWGCSPLKTWWRRGSTSKLAHSQGWQVKVECCGKPQCLSTWSFPQDCECSHNVAAGFPHIQWSKREQDGSLSIFYDLPQKSHAVISTVSLLVSQVLSIQCGRKLHRRMNTWWQKALEVFLSAHYCTWQTLSFERGITPKVPKAWSLMVCKLLQCAE